MGVSSKNDGKYLYYRCASISNRFLNTDCKIGYVRARLVDAIAWAWLYKLLSDKNELKSRIKNYMEEIEKIITPLREQLSYLSSSLEKKHATHLAMVENLFKLPELAQAKTLTLINQIEEEIKEQTNETKTIRQEIKKHAATLMLIKAYTSPMGEEWAKNQGITPNLFPEMAHIDRLKSDEPLTFEDKLKYVEDFDLKATIKHNEGDIFIHLTCRIGSDVLPLLNVSSLNHIQNRQKFFLSFSDLLCLNSITLLSFNQQRLVA